jgi:hypothetical protein
VLASIAPASTSASVALLSAASLSLALLSLALSVGVLLSLALSVALSVGVLLSVAPLSVALLASLPASPTPASPSGVHTPKRVEPLVRVTQRVPDGHAMPAVRQLIG